MEMGIGFVNGFVNVIVNGFVNVIVNGFVNVIVNGFVNGKDLGIYRVARAA